MEQLSNDILYRSAVSLLKQLIGIPSFSKEEDKTADAIASFLTHNRIEWKRIGNNIYSKNKNYNPALPTILLNSHHDTVQPNKGYTLDPFTAIEKDEKIFGLGSNDAGASLVCLIAAYMHLYEKQDSKYNLFLAATAEEEISGAGGIEMVLHSPDLKRYLEGVDLSKWCGIVGEPTQLDLAIAERGLMVLDCTVDGVAGHAAREEGENALYKALEDIEWFRSYHYPKKSEFLGEVKQSVTVIETENKTHNIVPSQCKFVVDVRANELYTFEELLETIRKNVKADVEPRSTRLRSTFIEKDHPLVKAGMTLGSKCYGSPTTSDKALIPFPTLKVGPGDSARSHTADEFIFIDEIRKGIEFYIALLKQLL